MTILISLLLFLIIVGLFIKGTTYEKKDDGYNSWTFRISAGDLILTIVLLVLTLIFL